MLFDICQVQQIINGSPAGYYYFKAPHGLYPDGFMSLKTGIVAEEDDQDWSDHPLTSVKELLRAEAILTMQVKIGTTNGGSSNAATQTWVRELHYAPYRSTTVFDQIIGVTWPIGKPAGGQIIAARIPRRVVSRR